MKDKRFVAVVASFLLLFAVLQTRLVGLAMNTQSAQAAAVQSSCLLPLYGGRAEIYDCRMRPLTGVATEQMALALPGDDSYAKLYRSLTEDTAAQLYSLAGTKPSLVGLASQVDESLGIYTFDKPRRYFEAPIAVHTLGYLGQDGSGVSGIERCYDELLAGGGDSTFVRCTTTAAGGLMAGTVPELVRRSGSGLSVQLTLDRDLQRMCEGIALEAVPHGAIVVMDVETGELRAVVSTPGYDPYDVAKSIEANDSGLLNRAISAYSVGSVFKPLVAAAALKAGMEENAVYECTGVIEVDGHLYHCNNHKAHGQMTMQSALEQSCNCYFIWLGQQLGGEAICELATLEGFGRATPLAEGYYGASGNLPGAEELKNSGQLASVSFGQGRLLATPVQLAACFNTFANDGVYIGPTLVRGKVEAATGKIVEAGPAQETMRVLPQQLNDKLQRMLRGVVEEGIAGKAKPAQGGAAGKTGTAQTGRADGEGNELLDSWFAGYYPAEEPRYTIVILKDSTHEAGETLAPVFARLCDALTLAESAEDTAG